MTGPAIHVPDHPPLRRPLAAATAMLRDGGFAAAVVAYVLAYVGALLLPGVPAAARELVGAYGLVPPGLLGALLPWWASRQPELAPRVRRGWRLLGVAHLVYTVADVAWAVTGAPPVSLATVGHLAFYGLAFAGLLAFPTTRRSSDDVARFRLDSATVMVGALMVTWYLVLGPIAVDGARRPPPELAVALAFPICDLLLLFGSSAILLRRPPADSRGPLALVALGTLAFFTADISWSVRVLEDRYTIASPLNAGWILGQCAAALGAHWHVRSARARAAAAAADAGDAADAGRWHFDLLPYVALVVGYALLLGVAVREWTVPTAGLVLGAGALTALVATRQLRAMADNARLEALAAARHGEARFAALVRQASDVIMVLDGDTAVQFASPSIERVFGHAPETALGTPLARLLHDDDAPAAYAALQRVLEHAGATAILGARVRAADGAWRHAEGSATNLLHDPLVRGVVLTVRDVTERRQLEAELAHQAFHDPLTGLANRALFQDRVAHALTLEARGDAGVAVLFLDLDDFKTVNDSLGHGAGDRLLVAVADRLRNATRGCDTVARLGGDEFAVLLEQVRHDDDAVCVAERILGALQPPVVLDGTDVPVGGSIGIARARAADDAEVLLRNADMAMYLAKQRGKGAYECFAPGMHAAVVERLELETDLRHALEQAQFRLVYQPTVALTTGRVTGFEALIRWQHPQRGFVSPAAFIPAAERTGLIVPIGRWVLGEACRQLAVWRAAMGAAGARLTMSVNVSPRQLQDGDRLVADVRAALETHAIPPECLTLEITESVMMQDTEAAHALLTALSALKVRLAVDDFGTGYSSLSYLERFPVDVLKIDKSFVDRVAIEHGDPAGESPLVAAIILIGRTLGLRVVAEGIERLPQARRLRELGCELAQGYLFARPMPPEEVDRRIAGGGVRAAG